MTLTLQIVMSNFLTSTTEFSYVALRLDAVEACLHSVHYMRVGFWFVRNTVYQEVSLASWLETTMAHPILKDNF